AAGRREPAHPCPDRVRSAVRDRLADDAVADQAVRRNGGRLDQDGCRGLDHVDKVRLTKGTLAHPVWLPEWPAFAILILYRDATQLLRMRLARAGAVVWLPPGRPERRL